MTDPMTQDLWRPRGALAGEAAISTVPAGAVAGVILAEYAPGVVLQVSARRGRSVDVCRAIGAAIGCDVPAQARVTTGATGTVVWSGPGQWLVMGDATADIARTLSTALAGPAAVIDQSSARQFVRLSGPDVRRCLAKVVGLDLHADVFGVGHAAMTDLAHVPVHLWRSSEPQGQAVYFLAAPRSYAGSVWHALVAAAAEYGVEVRPLDEVR